jgi:hypothetical protein
MFAIDAISTKEMDGGMIGPTVDEAATTAQA